MAAHSSPARRICATVWLAAEWVVPVTAAMPRTDSDGSTSSARTTGVNVARNGSPASV